MKKFINNYYRWLAKQMPSWKQAVISTAMIFVLVLGFISKKSIVADNGAGKGALWGGLTGATVGGLAGGGKGAGIGAVAGLGLGAIIGGASSNGGSSSDPYRQLDKEQRKLNKLQDRLARANPGSSKYQRLQQQVNTQAMRVQDLQSRLQAGPGYQQPAGYQPGYGSGY
jgi:hypothetical protein